MLVGSCESGTAVGWAFKHDVNVLNDDLVACNLEPLVVNGMCAMELAKKVFKHTSRTTTNFSQTEAGVAIGITDAQLKEHVADDDAILGSRIFVEVLRIAKEELHVVTMEELTNLVELDALTYLPNSTLNAGKTRQESSTIVQGHGSRQTSLDGKRQARPVVRKDEDYIDGDDAASDESKAAPRRTFSSKKAKKSRGDKPLCDDREAYARDVARKRAAADTQKENKNQRAIAEAQRHEDGRNFMRAALKNAAKLDPKDAQKWLDTNRELVADKENPHVPCIFGSPEHSGRLLYVRGNRQLHTCIVLCR